MPDRLSTAAAGSTAIMDERGQPVFPKKLIPAENRPDKAGQGWPI